VLRSEIFTRAREWPRLASAHPPGTGVLPTIFFKRGQNWLKIQRMGFNNFGVKGRSPAKLCHVTYHEAGLKTGIHFWRGPKIWKNKKRLKFDAISYNFRIWPRTSQELVQISTILNKLYRHLSLPSWTKYWWSFIDQQQSYVGLWPTQNRLCARI